MALNLDPCRLLLSGHSERSMLAGHHVGKWVSVDANTLVSNEAALYQEFDCVAKGFELHAQVVKKDSVVTGDRDRSESFGAPFPKIGGGGFELDGLEKCIAERDV